MSYNKLIKNFSFYFADDSSKLTANKYFSVIAVPKNIGISLPASRTITDWRIIYCNEIPVASGQYQLNVHALDNINGNLSTFGRVSNVYDIYFWNNSLSAWLFISTISVRKWEWYFNISIPDETSTHFDFSSISMIDGDTLPSQFDFVNSKYQMFIENIDIDRNITISSVTNTGFDLSLSPAGDGLPAEVLLKIEKI